MKFQAQSSYVVHQRWLLPVLTTSVAVMGTGAPAQAVQFNFSYAPGTTLEQMVGLEIAGGVWSSYLTDDVEVNIHVETTHQLPEAVIGGALPGIEAYQEYKTWREKTNDDSKTSSDWIAWGGRDGTKNKPNEYGMVANGHEVQDNEEMNLTRANAKALGMLNDNSNKLDGYIVLNDLSNAATYWSYDFQRQSDVPTDSTDFLSVAIHEIGHVIGYVSGVDDPGWLAVNQDSKNYDKDEKNKEGEAKGLKLPKRSITNATPLDMFRYSEWSAEKKFNDLTIGVESYFSINGGQTALAYFSTGQDTDLGGDGYQASHWKQQDNPYGIMDPALRPGQRREISDLDRLVMDVIGWDVLAEGTDLSSLREQAQTGLAQRLGYQVEWLTSDPTAAELLTEDRTQDIEWMIEKSQVYEWRRSSSYSWWQEGLRQHFLWQEIDSPTTKAQQSPSAQVPESTSGAGLLGMGLLTAGLLIKGRGENRR